MCRGSAALAEEIYTTVPSPQRGHWRRRPITVVETSTWTARGKRRSQGGWVERHAIQALFLRVQQMSGRRFRAKHDSTTGGRVAAGEPTRHDPGLSTSVRRCYTLQRPSEALWGACNCDSPFVASGAAMSSGSPPAADLETIRVRPPV